ncbi:MAG: Gx transporter family protein [Synergistaceae bacterium]|jgi:heptaprenyl diphosphate synthase|nr:Gx transporter family protein [Synergistaceae bacterium]
MKNLTVRDIATLAMMLSMILALSLIEQTLPPLPMNMRFGLSNVVTMYALFFTGKRDAFLLAALKSLFALLMRGPVAGILSLGGGVLSLLVIALLAAVWRSASFFILSVSGAIAHNAAQILIASWLVSTNLLPVYLPLLTGLGVLSGSLTAALLRVVMPVFKGARTGGAQIQKVSRT